MAEPQAPLDDRAAAVAEAARRGILPPDMMEAYQEAARRGILPPTPGAGVGEQISAGMQGLGKAFLSGITHEFVPSVVGIPGDLQKLAKEDKSLAPSASGEGKVSENSQHPTSAEVKQDISKFLPDYEPKNFTERSMRTAGSFAPGLALTPEIMAARAAPALAGAAVRYGARPLAGAAKNVFAPAFGSQGASEYVANTQYAKDNPWATPAAGMVAALASPSVAGKLITPHPAKDNEWLRMVRLLEGNGVGRLQYGQREGTSRVFGKSVHEMGDPRPAQMERYTAEPMRLAGSNEPRATGEAMQRLGAQHDASYGRLTRAYNMPLTGNAQTQIQQAVARHDLKALTPDNGVAQVAQAIEDAANANTGRNHGWLTGEQYQAKRSQLGERAANSAPHAAEAYRSMQRALDDAMSGSIRIANPRDADAFETLRNHYQNYLTLRHAIANRGPEAAQGIVTPGQLSGAVKAIEGEQALVDQSSPMARHARAGEGVFGLEPDKEKVKSASAAGRLISGIAAADVAGKAFPELGGTWEHAAAIGAGAYGYGWALERAPDAFFRALYSKVPLTNTSPLNVYKGNQLLPRRIVGSGLPSRAVNEYELYNKDNRLKKKDDRSPD